MFSNPLVTVGIVTRNRGHIIAHAIKQLTEQTYNNLEIIISDNDSTDNTEQICQEFAKYDRRIIYYRQAHNIGMYNNFNFVLKKASGEYFLWATDDDEWDNCFIKRMMEMHMRYPEIVVATSNYVLFNDNEKIITDYRYPAIAKPLTSVGIYIYHSVLITYGVIKTSVLKRTGGFFLYPWPIPDGIGDGVLNLKLLLRGPVGFDHDVLWKKRDSGNSFDKFTLISSTQWDSNLFFKVRRYLLFPILFLYNFVFTSWDVLNSQYSTITKVRFLGILIVFYMKANLEYSINIITGLVVLLRACIKTLLKP